MSHAELPASVDPYKLTEQDAKVAGKVPVARLTRLEPLLASVGEETVDVSLHFTRDAENRRILAGHLDAEVQVICQRCLETMGQKVESEFQLAVVASEEMAKQLPSWLEPLEMDGESVNLWSVVEDEMLLAMPPFPAHDLSQCPAAATLEAYAPPEEEEPAEESERENPFKVLQKLKAKAGKDESDTSDKE
ncbi:YceD family protein [Marinobacteraceae bacterium S3BR75-40.1]